MKNQYFGDKKDIFKFSVCFKLFEVLKEESLRRFIWVLMYTPNENYNLPWIDKRVEEFFNNIVKRVCRIYELFNKFNKEIDVEVISERFDIFVREGKEKRFEYFKYVCNRLSDNTLILIDPDTGIALYDKNNKNKNYEKSEKHILKEELERLYENLDDSSVLIIFQHKHRDESMDDFVFKLRKFLSGNLSKFLILGWEEAVMIILFKDNNKYCKVCKAFREYSKQSLKDKLIVVWD